MLCVAPRGHVTVGAAEIVIDPSGDLADVISRAEWSVERLETGVGQRLPIEMEKQDGPYTLHSTIVRAGNGCSLSMIDASCTKNENVTANEVSNYEWDLVTTAPMN